MSLIEFDLECLDRLIENYKDTLKVMYNKDIRKENDEEIMLIRLRELYIKLISKRLDSLEQE